MKRAIFSSLICALFAAALRPAGAADFNDMLPGARPMGLGTAYTAVAEGSEAIFYNPAGTAQGDFPALGASFGRMQSPVGNLSLESFSYTRPLPILPGSSVGAGFVGIHQNNSGDKSAFLLHFSDALRLPQFYLARPLKVGGNVRFEHVAKDASSGHKLGLGLDAGALLEVVDGLTTGVSIMEMTPDLGVAQPFLNLGTAYRWRRRLLLTGDLRVRRNLTQFFPGVELGVYQNLLKLRLGKGVPLDGTGQFVVGLGANFSPLTVDFAMAVPAQGVRRTGGGAQLSVQYKFGAPAFYGLFPGSAARESEDLKSRITELEKQKQDLDAQVTAVSADKTSLDTQVEAEEGRLRELREQLRRTEIDLDKKNYEAGHPRPKLPPAEAAKEAVQEPAPEPEHGPAPAKGKRPKAGREPRPSRAAATAVQPAASRFPLSHVVQPGDTLRRLAERYYGDPTLWERIYEANPDKVERGLPVEGTTLVIPQPPKR